MEAEHSPIKTRNNKRWIYFFRQALVAMILWNSYIITGLSKGTPTVAVPQLRKEANSTAAVSTEMASWIASVSGYSGAIGIFVVVPIGHLMGRKFTIIILSTNTLIVSAIIYFSKAAIHLLISQLMLGLTTAAEFSVFLLILTEYSSPEYRGVFLTIKSATMFWGIWIANAIGIFTHYKYIGLFGVGTSVFSFIISLFIPESPYWLAYKGRFDKCADAHRWLKGVNEESEKELDALVNWVKESDSNKGSVKSILKQVKIFLTAIKEPDIFKPLLLCCLVMSVFIFSGKLVCSVYALEMMKKITDNESSVYLGVLILDGFTVCGMYIGCALSKILKRRTLLISTSLTGTTFLFAMCIYLYLIKFSVLAENDYVIIALLVGYSIAVCCGPIILSSSISAELLPVRFRSFCALIYALVTLILSGTVLKISPYAFNAVGFQGVYLGFGICSVLLITLVYKYVPETKDRTIYEIAETFKPKVKKEVHTKLLDTL